MQTNGLVKSILKVLGVVIALSAFVGTSNVVVNANATDHTLEMEGFKFVGEFTAEDVAYFQENLHLLRAQLPAWHQYLLEARPIAFNFDAALGERGRAAEARCCEADGTGVITFGHHFGQLAASPEAEDQTPEARRIAFLGLLAHELTHIRDQRAGRFTAKTDRKSCIAAESSGLSKQVEIKRDLAKIQLTGEPASAAIYRSQLDRQISVETNDLRSRAFWDFYCGGY